MTKVNKKDHKKNDIGALIVRIVLIIGGSIFGLLKIFGNNKEE